VDLLTIGAFSRAARLSPKALRLYDSVDRPDDARVYLRAGEADPADQPRAGAFARPRISQTRAGRCGGPGRSA
jgi:hypothetical protein